MLGEIFVQPHHPGLDRVDNLCIVRSLAEFVQGFERTEDVRIRDIQLQRAGFVAHSIGHRIPQRIVGDPLAQAPIG